MPLTAKYIEEHSYRVHTADSFGRGIMDNALKAAHAAAVKGGGTLAQDFQMDAKITVSPIEPLGCIRVCYNTPIGVICVHIPL